ncbi:hypothetical protein QFZ60_001314 [Arthrobacter sp. B2I5]|uniref:DUF6541 family protein n=1 Tax=Arthrobacter sp. B2I5 TaxID=3042266 RepID=UPI002786F52D|nr:DUF6541 family protein [Arthrobacter sp. B2I5]MDQ0825141.1 hypothetical protein [Arthrobacter sp. B2I5]
MSWVAALPTIAIAAGLIFIPGWAAARAMGFIGFEAIGLAPAFSTAICGGFGVISGAVGIPWSPLTFAIASIASVALAYGLGRLPVVPTTAKRLRPGHFNSAVVPIATALSIAAAALIGGARLVRLYGAPDHIAQVFDNVFHLNAIRYILESGNASSLTLASFQGNSGLEAIYPAAWHAFAATVVQISSADLHVAENALNLVIGALVWPVSSVFFVQLVISRHPLASLSAALLSVSQIAFPFLMNVWGPLFPYALAVSLLPVALAITAALVGLSRTESTSRIRWALALIPVVGGIGTAHMSSFNTLIALASPLLILAWWNYLRSVRTSSWRSKRALVFIAVSVTAPLLVIASWTKIRPALYDNWGPTVRSGAALGEVLTNSTMQEAAAWIVSLLALAGMVAGFREKRHRWLTASYAVAAALYVVDAAWSKGFWRDFITGTWYQDTYRLAALLPILVTPLAAYGTLALWRQSLVALAHRTSGRRHLAIALPALLSVVAAAVPVLAAFHGPVGAYIARTKAVYSLDENSAILSKQELALTERLGQHVPKGVKIADNPWNGSSWAYAFGGSEVLTPHLFATPDPDRTLISQRLKDAASDPAVCKALRNQNVQYVLDFGSHYLLNLPPSADYPGVTDIGEHAGFQEVDSEGPAAKLYKITACG